MIEPGQDRPPPLWTAVGAAMALDAAAGVLAWALASRLGAGPGPAAFFAACAAMAALAHAVLLPGLLWAAGPVSPGALAMRTVVAAFAVVAALVAGGLAMAGVGALAGWVPWLADAARGEWTAYGAFVTVFTFAGVAAGLGAAVAQWVDHRHVPGPVPVRVHVAGGVAGVWVVLGFAALSSLQGPPGSRVMLGVAGLVLAGLPHSLLMARALGRAGQGWPPAPEMLRRAAWCCGALGIAAVAVRLVSR